MVRAILEGRKTQTRRVVKNPYTPEIHQSDIAPRAFDCPYGQPGDRLWVRETWQINHVLYDRGPIPKAYPVEFGEPVDMLYRADGEFWEQFEIDEGGSSWRPSIFMPRWASRLLLDVARIRVERAQDISEEDAIAEGMQCAGIPAALTNRAAFAHLWNQINIKHGWESNPWVWVVEFPKVI